MLRMGANPILNLKPPADVSPERQRRTLDLLRSMNETGLDPDDAELSARIASYELAFRMQAHAPKAVDLSRETAAMRTAYGLDDKRSAEFGTRCLLARRLVERGVRFVQLYSGGGPLVSQWDAHDDVNDNHERMSARVDRPIAALLKDLKQRGLLDSTLVVWASEFGRMPMSQGGKGRDHNPYGYTMWLSGGGVKGGQAIGATDEFGLNAVANRVSVHDFHATILHLLGLDHEKLTYLHGGRDEPLDGHGGRGSAKGAGLRIKRGSGRRVKVTPYGQKTRTHTIRQKKVYWRLMSVNDLAEAVLRGNGREIGPYPGKRGAGLRLDRSPAFQQACRQGRALSGLPVVGA